MNTSTILIVDDDPTILTAMSKILTPHFRVRASRTGKHALKIASSEPKPELIFLDLCMPEMDGYAVLQELKKNSATAHIPVLFVTAMEATNDYPKGLQLGAVDYVLKPIEPTLLLARAKNYLAMQQASIFLTDKQAVIEAEIQTRVAEYRQIQSSTINTLATLVQISEVASEQHIIRKQSWIKLLAELLREYGYAKDILTTHYIDLLMNVTSLYDMGMLHVAKEIIQKPGKLSFAEWQQIKRHPVIGASAIEKASENVQQSIEFLTILKEVCRWHHERWDGQGYPDGIAEINIPLSARIITLVDVFDALLSERSYREAVLAKKARDIIVAERGHQFDPNIVDVFLDNFESFVRLSHHPSEFA